MYDFVETFFTVGLEAAICLRVRKSTFKDIASFLIGFALGRKPRAIKKILLTGQLS